jgi:hypothetical protein
VRPRATTALILALAAGVAIGCGGDDEGGDPIPAEQAAALERQLESIQNRFQFGGSACGDITGGTDPNTVPVRTAIESLPQTVDPEVRTALENGFERLFELVQEQCDTQQGQEEPPAPVETQPTETIPPEDDEGDDEGEDEEALPPPETGPTGTEPPAEPPPEVPPEQDGSLPPGQDGSLPPGQGGSAPGNSGEGGSGTAGQGGGGGAVVPGDVP